MIPNPQAQNDVLGKEERCNSENETDNESITHGG